MQAQGELISRQMQQQKSTALLEMAAGRLQQAKQARQQATQSFAGGIGALGGVVGGSALAGGGFDKIGEGFRSMLDLPTRTGGTFDFSSNLNLDNLLQGFGK